MNNYAAPLYMYASLYRFFALRITIFVSTRTKTGISDRIAGVDNGSYSILFIALAINRH